MYLYGDRYKSVNAWNAVNVPDKHGVLRHGSVISVVDGGLVIDFACPGQRSEFVQYGRIFKAAAFPSAIRTKPSDGSDKVKFTKDADIQVLIRLRPNRPWTWLPGKLLTLEPSFSTGLAYAVVEVRLEGSAVTDLIPCAQVRLPLSSKQLNKAIVGEGDFVTRSCPLPKNYWSSISSTLSSVFSIDLERRYNALPVSEFSESLSYLQRHNQDAVQPEQLATLFRWSKADVARYSNGREYPDKEWICRHNSTATSSIKRQDIPNPEGDLLHIPLPMELLAEIFGCLDTITRIRCRRTCASWNSILTVRHLCKDVRISLAEKSFSPSPDYDWSPLYAITGCVLKCINRSTQSLSITGEDDTYTKLSFLDYIRRAVKDSRMERLILYNLKCQISYGSGQSMEKAMDQFVHNCSCCQILTFQGTTLRFVVDRGYGDPAWMAFGGSDAFEVHIPFGSIELGAPDVVIQLWDLVERNCGKCDDDEYDDRQRIAEWIKSQKPSEKTGAIIEILNAVQGNDPRKTTHYRGKKWTAEKLSELDVSKLTRITLHALHTLKCRERSMTLDAWESGPVCGHLPPAF